ncbi:MAG: ATP synthase subunit I [Salinisphaera sp.]|uniref:N-ATPase subunit AtpR n=1 Tax=Salinisphaera sp. TaxID=1914330 RepID=UPI003C797245
MSDLPWLGLALLAGGALGTFFFGGLWWTVRRCLESPQPVLWLGPSLLLRIGVTVAGFYVVGQGDWRQLLACLIGFVIARFIVTAWLPARPTRGTAP